MNCRSAVWATAAWATITADGFEAFTNARGVLYHTTMLDPDLRYPPYGENKFTRKIAGQLLP